MRIFKIIGELGWFDWLMIGSIIAAALFFMLVTAGVAAVGVVLLYVHGWI